MKNHVLDWGTVRKVEPKTAKINLYYCATAQCGGEAPYAGTAPGVPSCGVYINSAKPFCIITKDDWDRIIFRCVQAGPGATFLTVPHANVRRGCQPPTR